MMMDATGLLVVFGFIVAAVLFVFGVASWSVALVVISVLLAAGVVMVAVVAGGGK